MIVCDVVGCREYFRKYIPCYLKLCLSIIRL